MCRERGVSISGALCALILAFAGGCRCQSGMEAFDVRVTPHLTMAGNAPPVEVNLIGVSDQDYQMWLTYPVAHYWSPRDPLRSGAKPYVMSFAHDNAGVSVLRKDDPIWQTWRQNGATHLFVIAFLPMVKESGDADPRRAELPLDRCVWNGTSQLDIDLLDDRIVAVSQPR